MNSNLTIAQFLNVKTFPFQIKDENGRELYYENSYGYWYKNEFDVNGNKTYHESSIGFWFRFKHDSDSRLTSYLNSNGYWSKSEFDSNGKEIYWEDNNGILLDNRPKPTIEITLQEIAKLKGVNVSQIRIKE
jgi:hypothetical protein